TNTGSRAGASSRHAARSAFPIQSLDVTQLHRLPQSLFGIAGRDEFLADVARVFQIQQFLHDRRVTDVPPVVRLGAGWGARRGVWMWPITSLCCSRRRMTSPFMISTW